jgi:hypothetical protein
MGRKADRPDEQGVNEQRLRDEDKQSRTDEQITTDKRHGVDEQIKMVSSGRSEQAGADEIGQLCGDGLTRSEEPSAW